MAAFVGQVLTKVKGASGPKTVRLTGLTGDGTVVLVDHEHHGTPFTLTDTELRERYAVEDVARPPTELERVAAQQDKQREALSREYFEQDGAVEDVSALRRAAQRQGLQPETPEDVFEAAEAAEAAEDDGQR